MSDVVAELLERFRRGGELVAVVTTGAAGAELDYVPEPGKWSVRQLTCHLADSEVVGAFRLRRLIAEENPSIEAYDEKAWATGLDYHKRKISQAIEAFRRIRGESYELLKDLSAEAYARTGTHSERGPLSLLDMLRIYAEHAEAHARQIQTVRQQFKTAKAAAVSTNK